MDRQDIALRVDQAVTDRVYDALRVTLPRDEIEEFRARLIALVASLAWRER